MCVLVFVLYHQATGARVTGLDLGCNMVGLALEKLNKQNIPKVTTDLQLVLVRCTELNPRTVQ